MSNVLLIGVLIYLLFAIIAVLLFYFQLKIPVEFKEFDSQKILVPFRNESKNASDYLGNLNSEVSERIVFINDHSEDGSDAFLRSNGQTVLDLPEPLHGKKQALVFAANSVDSEYIILNDIDIQYSEAYLKLLRELPNLNFDICVLPVWFQKESSLLNQLIRLDFAQIQLATFSYKGNLGSGANLLVNRRSFLKYRQEYENQILSGDDYFLIKACRRHKGKVVYIFNKDLQVFTKGSRSLKELLSQRARWISKIFKKGSFTENSASFLIFLLSFLPYFLTISYLATQEVLYLYILFIKLFSDFLIIVPILYLNKELRLLYLFPLLVLLYPFYYIAVAIETFRKQKWKGRNV